MRQLGSLESEVMHVLWAADEPLAVRQVLEVMQRDRDLAYTTVLTVLDNLHRKALVARTKQGRAWTYAPAITHANHVAELMGEVLAETPDRGTALLRFVEQMPAHEVAELRTLLDALDSGEPDSQS